MKTLIKKELRQTRKILIIWLAIMLLLCGFCYFEFLSLKSSIDEMAQTVSQFPRLLMIMFGVKTDLNTALGWYTCLYFWTGILAFAYAMYLGISCIAKEVKQGTSAYLFTKPVSRKDIVLSKVAASVLNLLTFVVFTGICNYTMIILPAGGLEQAGAEVTTTIGMFLTQVIFYAAGLFIASFMKTYKAAVRIGGCFVLVVYTIAIMAEYTGIHFMDYLTPLRYFDVYEVSLHGIGISFLILTAGIMAVCIVGSLIRWENKEL